MPERRYPGEVPTQAQVDLVRGGHSDCPYTDSEIREALVIAADWIGGLRYSLSIVARNVLLDGYPHP